MHRDRLTLASFPALACAPEPPERVAERAGTVVLLHGLGGEKEDLLDELERLGSEGLLAVAVDAVGHGRRRTPQLEERILGSSAQEEAAFYDVITATAAEVPALLDALAGRGWLPQGRAALIGVSMGGFIALRARILDPRVAVVVSISGSPRWQRHADQSPEQHPDAFWPTALMFLHGERDEVVAPGPSLDFVEALRARYQADPERLRRVTFPDAGHIFPADAWSAVMDHALRFCRRYLKA